MDQLSHVIHPVGLYLLLVLGGVGVCMALPRRGVNPQPIGALLAASAGGLGLLLLGLRAGEHLPNLFFYVFSAVALGAALRVITHPRPVYAALYFIMTVLASAGLFVLLAAEFVAFALIIVYAGAILITYLFVIMLATQAPTEDRTEGLADYDATAREPIAATVVGFLLLGALTTMLFAGVRDLRPAGDPGGGPPILELLPGKAETALRNADLLRAGDRVENVNAAAGEADIVSADGRVRKARLPAGVASSNVEGVAFSLLRDKPGSIEIAGVILLMAMLGAVVLARKQVQIDEEAKARHAATLGAGGDA
ncbi:MAG: NADH-quinone oxidoreductase subunit J [Phycisphaerales bacterium]